VRELENAMHRAFFVAEQGAPAQNSHAVGGTASSSPQYGDGLRAARDRLVRDFERRYLTWLMAETRGNVSAASRKAMTARRQLGRLLRRHGIDRGSFRDA
jgi:DNA-binding NtrC family response regulator